MRVGEEFLGRPLRLSWETSSLPANGAALAHRGLIREVRVLGLMTKSSLLLGVLGRCKSMCVSSMKECSADTARPR